ncbi:hypothetical protein E6O75_ATG05887 [Venturia nashicola]|uniref:Uncharacterized protein n=1 Tax=Venturia nashicola TaxID=86259 RepID=A0A4Z1NSK8_9PEZI|nr:hypothetical protein E6O75_ATG05887 [Venturia nashicola]
MNRKDNGPEPESGSYVRFQWTALGPIEVSRSHLRQIIADHLVDINTNNILTLESAIILEHLNLTNLPDMSSTLTHAILNETEYHHFRPRCDSPYGETQSWSPLVWKPHLSVSIKVPANPVTWVQVNCLNEIFFKDAIFRARHLDSERKAHPSKTPPPLWAFQFPSKTVSTLLISTLQQDWDVTSMN